MKYIKNIELFERAITRDPMPIGDFLFDKFFKSPQAKIRDYKPKFNNKFYMISIKFSKQDIYLYEGELNSFLEFIKFMKNYCEPEKDVQLSIIQYYININIKMTSEKVEEIKKLPEYNIWFKSVTDEFSDFRIRKMAKKYNL